MAVNAEVYELLDAALHRRVARPGAAAPHAGRLRGRRLAPRPKARAGTLPIRSDAWLPLDGDGERILVVEDDPQELKLLIRLLDKAGYRCSSAPDAADARRLVRRGASSSCCWPT